MPNPKKPDEIKQIEGTFRKDRTAKNKMLPSRIDGLPKAPGILLKEAINFWDSTVKELHDLKMLYNVDLGLLAAYCNEMAMYFKAMEKIKNDKDFEDGKAVIVASRCLNNALKIGSQFGFTPSARTKIEAPPQDKQDDFSEFE